MTAVDARKPLGRKAYGSIAHLPGSRLGPGDHHCHEGQARIATVKARDKHDTIIVQEKLDGSCVAVAKVDGEIIPLGRSGYRAVTSKFYQHILWHQWVMDNYTRFDALLRDGERVVGEWLAQAHGTRYDIQRDPFIAFDIMVGTERLTYEDMNDHATEYGFETAAVLCAGPASIDKAIHCINYRSGNTYGLHGALDPVEGAVWRVERHGAVDFLCKYVRPDKVDGCYLESVSGSEPVWNWRP